MKQGMESFLPFLIGTFREQIVFQIAISGTNEAFVLHDWKQKCQSRAVNEAKGTKSNTSVIKINI